MLQVTDIARRVGAVTRYVGTRERDGRPAHVIIASRGYDSTPEDVWDALTSAERIPRWFAPVSGDLRLGGRFQVQGNAGGEILRCEPPRDLALTWEYGGAVSWVDVRLRPRGEHETLLELEHVAHVPDEFWDQFGPGAVGVGWDLALLGLDLHLATGAANDPAAAEAWLATDEGRGFVRGSSEGWGSASIASGTSEEAARGAVERTTAFYTPADPDRPAE